MKKYILKITLGLAVVFGMNTAYAQCPVITCPADIVVDNDPGICGAVVNYTVNGVDACAPIGSGNILVVSDVAGATEIAPALTSAGFTVTNVTNDFVGGNNTVLQGGGLNAYDAIYWHAVGGGVGDIHNAATFTNLSAYVSAGGNVFVHGYDIIASPTDNEMITFLGGTGSVDVPSGGGLGTIAGPACSLTDGVANIVGLTLSNAGDHDALTGIGAGVVGVAPNASGWDWTVRTLGSGEIAWVSTGQAGGPFSNWTTPGSGYAEAMLNFAYNSTCNAGGNILVVSDLNGATEIAPALTAAGYTVTNVINDFSGGNNTVLQGPGLDSYDVIFWHASGTGFGDNHNAATFTNLTTYINNGGAIFVHGYDVIASPVDNNLIAFLGGTGTVDVPSGGGLGTIVGPACSLTDGVTNIVGLTLSNSGDHDALTGIGAGVVGVAPNASGWDWTVKTLGSGEIAWVSTGQNTGSFPNWTTPGSGYAEALMNFAYNHSSCPLPGGPILTMLSGYGDGAVFPVGVTTVTYEITDYMGGNADTCSFMVTVNDTSMPVLDVPVLPDYNGDCGANPPLPTATDNCGTIMGVSDVPLPITTIGTTLVTWTYDDGYGNIVTQTQNIINTDMSAPVPDTSILEGVVECFSATPTAPTATDACEGPVTGVPDVTLPITAPGLTVVTWTFTDGSGNSSTITQNVLIQGPDVSVSQTFLPTLISNEVIATYQWLDCDNGYAVIPGATNQDFTSPVTGNFAVEVTEDGCTDTSACYLVDYSGLMDLESFVVELFPNPNNGTFTINVPDTQLESIQVMDNAGKIIFEMNECKVGKNIIELESIEAGNYQVKLIGENGVVMRSIVVQ